MDLDHEDLLVNSTVKAITIKAACPQNELRFEQQGTFIIPLKKATMT
jgi:hypothetical protein